MPFYFTTLSRYDNIPSGSLEQFLAAYEKWLYVHEYGRDRNNHHIHLVVKIDDPIRTDKFTEKIRSLLYPKEFIDSLPCTRYLVKTKLAKNWKRLYGEYLLKEENNKDFDSLTYKGFSEAELKSVYKKSNLKRLFEKDIMLTLASAPRYMALYLEDNDLNWNHKEMNEWVLLTMMGADGYITHHLMDQTNLAKISAGLKQQLQTTLFIEELKSKYKNITNANECQTKQKEVAEETNLPS